MLMRLLLTYILLGGAMVTALAIIFGVYVSAWISLILSIIYFIGLGVVVTFHTRRGKLLEKRMLFNMGLILANMNYNKGEVYPDHNLI